MEWKSYFESDVFLIFATIFAYAAGVWFSRVVRIKWLHPIVYAIALLVGLLQVLRIEYDVYYDSVKVIHFMLGPSVVLMGYLLYEQLPVLREKILNILISVTAGAVVGVGSVLVLGEWLDIPIEVIRSLESKSVTTPIALSISERMGGIGSVTAISVVITGILGSVIGYPVLKLLRIQDRVARGLAMGASAHAIGTARALECSAVEGAFGGLAIGLMGVITALVASLVGII